MADTKEMSFAKASELVRKEIFEREKKAGKTPRLDLAKKEKLKFTNDYGKFHKDDQIEVSYLAGKTYEKLGVGKIL